MEKHNPFATEPLDKEGLKDLSIKFDDYREYYLIIDEIYLKYNLYVHLVPHPTGEYNMLWGAELVEGDSYDNSKPQDKKITLVHDADYHYHIYKVATIGINAAIKKIKKDDKKPII